MQEKEQIFSPIKQRMLFYVEQLGISKREFYSLSGISRGTLESKTGITEDTITKFFATYPDVNPTWLITGEGRMLMNTGDENAAKGLVVASPGIGIPLIPIDALAGIGLGELVITEHDIEQRYVVPEFEKAEFLIRVKGSSMYPKYNAGDLLACRRVEKTDFIQWNKTYVLDTTQGILVKRILKGEHKNHWILRSDNKDYLDIDVEPDKHVNGISLVIGVIRLE